MLQWITQIFRNPEKERRKQFEHEWAGLKKRKKDQDVLPVIDPDQDEVNYRLPDQPKYKLDTALPA